MHKLKHIPFIVFLSISSVCVLSCTRSANKNSTEQNRDFKQEGFTAAKVIRYDLDGCSWMLELPDGKKLQPTELQADFQKQDLEVWIKYQPKKDAMGICMAGEIVQITNIELRK